MLPQSRASMSPVNVSDGLNSSVNSKIRVIAGIADVFYQNVLAIAIVFIFFTNVPLFLNEITDTYIAGTINVLLLVAIVPFILLRLRDSFGFLRTELAWWALYVTAMYGYNVLRVTQGEFILLDAELIDEVNRFQRQALMIGIMVVVYLSDPRVFTRCLILVAPLIPLAIIISFFAPELLGLKVENSGRAAGMYKNPNLASEALLVTLLLIHLNIRRAWLLIIYAFVGVAVILTFSRSGIAGWILLGMYLIYRGQLPRKFLLIPLVVALSYSTLLLKAEGFLFDAMDGNELRVTRLIDRLTFFSEIGSEDAFDDSSGESRANVALNTLGAVIEQPIAGHVLGPRAEFGVEAHNLPLEYWYTFGVTGLIAWLWMCRILFKSGLRQGLVFANPFLLVFLWLSMFNHQQFTQMFWWVLFAMVAFSHIKFESLTRRQATMGVKKVKKRRRRRSSSHVPGGKVSQSW